MPKNRGSRNEALFILKAQHVLFNYQERPSCRAPGRTLDRRDCRLDFSYPVRAALQHCAASLARAFHERSQWARRRPKAVALAKKLHRASPKTGKRMSLRRVSAKLAEAGHLNERGKAFNPRSIKAMGSDNDVRPVRARQLL